MRTEDTVSTECIEELEIELKQLRIDFKEKVGVIQSKITSIKSHLPKENSRRQSNIIVEGCRVVVINGKHKGIKGKVTRVTAYIAWIKDGNKSSFLKRKHNLRVL